MEDVSYNMGETTAQLSVPTGRPALALTVVPDSSLYTRYGKRLFDLWLGLLLAIVFLPAVLLIAMAIRVGLGSEIMYSQQRIGLNGNAFTIWKFRTMRHDRRKAQHTHVRTERRNGHKADHDPRHTGLGRLLRRLSLDELPQLWNVVRGDMSLVGPRPELVDVAHSRGYADHVRHTVRPGITGPYQLSPLRAIGDLRDGLELDAQYVTNVSFRADAGYLLGTVGVMLGRKSLGT